MVNIKKATRYFLVFITIVSFCLLFISPVGGYLSAAAPNQIKVFLDPGHGGADPGAVHNGVYEKVPNLTIALKLKAKLESKGYTVIMRRNGDNYHTLDQIVNMANSSGADIFISIHNNASITPKAYGTETYWCPNGINGSSQLASLVQSNVVSQAGTSSRGVKTANFRVIKYTNMPAALVECAFVSNPNEANKLKNDSFLEKCANGLFSAIDKFAQGLDKESGFYINGGSDSAGFAVYVDYPKSGSVKEKDFYVTGWAADLSNRSSTGVTKVEVYDGANRNENTYLGEATFFERPALADAYNNPGMLNAGYICRVDKDKLTKGEHILYIYAYDGNGNYSYATTRVNIADVVIEETNELPVANTGGPYEAIVGEEINVDGSASSDSDGSITQYNWDLGDGNTADTQTFTYIYDEAGEYTVQLTVVDDKGESSLAATTTATISEEQQEEEEPAEEEDEQQQGSYATVSNSTSVTGYIDITTQNLISIFEDKGSNKIERATRLAPLYIQYCQMFDIRPDIAWAQMIHETGFLEFTGDVSPEQNNFCGMGATGGGVPGNNFETEELGVIAHIAHLAWYYYPDHVNQYCSSEYDPRHFGNSHYRYTGDTSLGFLNGRWAPGSTYTNKIIQFANQVLQNIDEGQQLEIIADAGDDLEIDVGETVEFDASESVIPTSPESVVTYRWDWDSDGEFDDETENAVIEHQFDQPGEFVITLKINSDGLEDTDSLDIYVNDIPTSDPGGPYEAFIDEEITFDASGSVDSDGEIIEYLWDFGDGETSSTVEQNIAHTYQDPGDYTVSLIVTDEKQAQSAEATTTALISVDESSSEGGQSGDDSSDEDQQDYTVVADAGADQTVNTGEEVILDGSASTIEPTDVETTVSYSWDWDGDGEYDLESEEPTASYIFDDVGIYEVVLKVTAFEDVSSTDTVQVTVEESQEEPTGGDNEDQQDYTVVADAGADQTVNTGEEVILDGSASTIEPTDVETTVSYSWDWDGDGEYDLESEEPTASYIFDETGVYEVVLQVNAFGDVSDTDIIKITVEDKVETLEKEEQQNIAPVSEPGGPYTGETGRYVRFDGSGSTDGDGEIVQYQWNFGDNIVSTEPGHIVYHIYSNPGSYTLSLKVTDDDGATHTETTTVDIVDNNSPPSSNPGGPYEGKVNVMMKFDGSASTDSDGKIVQYQWNFGDNIVSTEPGPTVYHVYSGEGTYTLSLKVTDDDGATHTETTTVTVGTPSNVSPITNSTSFVGYKEVTVNQLVKIFTDRGSSKADWARRIAPIYIQYGKYFNLRADLAWAMMCHETGFLEYTGDVRPDQNNFCGLGATGGVPGNSFATEELGIIAHYAHLAWYYYPNHINEYCNNTYDPRHFGSSHYKYTGDTTLGFLNGRWAPGSTYTNKIIKFANQIYGF